MRPGVWSYVFGGIGMLAFLGTGYYYFAAGGYLPWWGIAILWVGFLALLAFGVWLMRMAPGWVLALPILSLIVLALLTTILEIAYALLFG